MSVGACHQTPAQRCVQLLGHPLGTCHMHGGERRDGGEGGRERGREGGREGGRAEGWREGLGREGGRP